jgi:hypothetical protein
LTRRSIPLVCHQWHANGLQFLYQHINLVNFEQIRALHRTLDSLVQKDRVQRISWIQGLELLLGPTPQPQIREYWHLAGDLIVEMPPSNLKVLAIDSIYKEAPSFSWKALKRVRESVEVLQLGYGYSGYTFDSERFLENLASPPNPEVDDWATFPHLREFVFTVENGPARITTTPSMLVCVRNSFQSLQNMALCWPTRDISAQQCLSLFDMAKNLTNIYIRTPEPNLLFYSNLEALFTALKSLKHFTVAVSIDYSRDDAPVFAHSFVHTALEDITLVLEFPSSYKAINNLDPLFIKVRSRELPNLAKIVIRGPYTHGCLDSGLIMPPSYRKKWSQAIKICDRKGIKLVTPGDDLIHLWEERHGLKKEGNTGESDQESESSKAPSIQDEGPDRENDEEGEDASTNTSDDSQWYRLEDDSGTPETSSDHEIWNDSDDEPYRYVARPDIELVNSESNFTEDER